MTALATSPPPAPHAASGSPAPPAPSDRRDAVFATFDQAYRNTWPAEMGQFWADRYPPGAAPYANLVHARDRRVCALCPGGRAILDIGSGYGDLLYLLRDKYPTLRGIDPSARSCAMATHNLDSRAASNDFRFVQGIAEDLPFDDRSFDAVICLDTYEHIEPAVRTQALAEAKRVLTPGGRLIVVTPSRRTINALAFVDNLLTMRHQIRHHPKAGFPIQVFGTLRKDYCEVFCTKGELLRDMRRAGFRVERFERCSFYPAPERGGFFYRFFEKLPAGHPKLLAAMRVINSLERIRILNQKMLAVAIKPEAP